MQQVAWGNLKLELEGSGRRFVEPTEPVFARLPHAALCTAEITLLNYPTLAPKIHHTRGHSSKSKCACWERKTFAMYLLDTIADLPHLELRQQVGNQMWRPFKAGVQRGRLRSPGSTHAAGTGNNKSCPPSLRVESAYAGPVCIGGIPPLPCAYSRCAGSCQEAIVAPLRWLDRTCQGAPPTFSRELPPYSEKTHSEKARGTRSRAPSTRAKRRAAARQLTVFGAYKVPIANGHDDRQCPHWVNWPQLTDVNGEPARATVERPPSSQSVGARTLTDRDLGTCSAGLPIHAAKYPYPFLDDV